MHCGPPNEAPFRITFETPQGERVGVVAYAFFARPFKTKIAQPMKYCINLRYGCKNTGEHELWQDPRGLNTTLLLGINFEQAFFVGADPILHSPTKMGVSIRFRQKDVDAILGRGWQAWERERRPQDERPVEVLVGGRQQMFLRYVRFEREALAEDQGHRQLLAERMACKRPARAPIRLRSAR